MYSLWGSLFVEGANREANTGNERLDEREKKGTLRYV